MDPSSDRGATAGEGDMSGPESPEQRPLGRPRWPRVLWLIALLALGAAIYYDIVYY